MRIAVKSSVKLQTVNLGGLTVSRLCFGTEPFALQKGPDGKQTQGDKTPAEGGTILADALKLGVNFWDTSDDYGTHTHVREGLRRVQRNRVIVADKSNASTYEDGVKAVDFTLRDLGTDYIDIMFLHIVPPKSVTRIDANDREYVSHDLKGRRGALKAYFEAKRAGRINAIALSTHSTETLRQVLDYPEIDVVCAPLNKGCTYLDDGTQTDRLDALRDLHDAGKGVYVIKLLASGRYRDDADSCIRYVLRFRDFIDAWNIGMYDVGDVKRNLKIFREELG